MIQNAPIRNINSYVYDVPHKMKDILPFTVFESNSSIGHEAYYIIILLEISKETYRETKNE
jgi:hypothetical protein